MATSAATLSQIILDLSKKYKFDHEKAIHFLADKELLPKKMLPKDKTGDSIWASTKAKELAEKHNIVPDGKGSGKNDKWTLKDVEKLLEQPTKDKLLVSPNALNLANEHNLSLVGKKGSGTNGRILLKDVQSWLEKDDEEEEEVLNISPRALQEAHKLGITDDELWKIHGKGVQGRILLEDVTKYHASSGSSASEDEDDDDQ